MANNGYRSGQLKEVVEIFCQRVRGIGKGAIGVDIVTSAVGEIVVITINANGTVWWENIDSGGTAQQLLLLAFEKTVCGTVSENVCPTLVLIVISTKTMQLCRCGRFVREVGAENGESGGRQVVYLDGDALRILAPCRGIYQPAGRQHKDFYMPVFFQLLLFVFHLTIDVFADA